MNHHLHAQEAFSIPITSDGSVPEEIQWMPPGEHTITALDANREPVTKVIRVGPATAERMAGVLQGIRSQAAAGSEDLPYIDFNHQDQEAAGHVLEFRWGGDDPATGGVRARIRWTNPGIQALQGRAYRRFSPSFHVNADGEVVGASVNMGGLVNRAAFKTITPIWSRAGNPDAGGQVNQRKEDIMSDLNKELADLSAANTDLQKQVVELNAKLATASQVEVVKAKDVEIETLKGQVQALQAKIADQAKASAKAVVEAAVKAGKLAPQATELHAKWVTLIAADPSLAETLNAMAPNPALGGTITGSTSNAAGGSAAGTEAEQFVQAVAAQMDSGKTKAQAIDLVIAKSPKLYEAWRNSEKLLAL